MKVWLVLIALPLSIITREEKRVQHAFALKMLMEHGKVTNSAGFCSASQPEETAGRASARAETLHQGPFVDLIRDSRWFSVRRHASKSSVLCLEHSLRRTEPAPSPPAPTV